MNLAEVRSGCGPSAPPLLRSAAGQADKTTKTCELGMLPRCAVTVGSISNHSPASGTRREAMNQPASTSVVRNYGPSRCRSDGAQIFGRGLARLSISDNVVRDLLSLVEAMHSGAFDRADMHEHILAAVIRLDEAKAFLAIEPFHGSLCHISSLRCVCNEAARQRSRFVRVLGKVISPTRMRRGQLIRPKLDRYSVGHCGWGRKVHRQDFEKKLAIGPVSSYLQ
jgi:hypothetical protein